MQDVINHIVSTFWIIVWILAVGLAIAILYHWMPPVVRFLRHIKRRREERTGDVLVVPDGPMETEVLGEQYRVELLREIYRRFKSETILVSITPESPYQHEQGWPKPTFVNVNLRGSRSTSRDNWLGYIPKRFWDCDFKAMIDSHDRVDVHAHIVKSADGLDLIVTVDEGFVRDNPA